MASAPSTTSLPAPDGGAPGPAEQHHIGVILGTLLLAGLSFALLQTMVAPAIPEIAQVFDASPTAAAWVLTGFLVSASVATPIIGKLGDLYGKGRMLTIVLVTFAAGSLLAAFADSIEVLIAARLLQGVAGGVFPLSFGIIRDTFPPRRIPIGIGSLSATFGIGGGIGLVLSGVIVDSLGVSWLFVVGLLAVPAAFIAWRFIPPSPIRERTRIDWLGALVLSAGLAALLIGVSKANAWGWTSSGVVGLIGGGLIVLAGWVALELRMPEPLVEMRVLRQRSVLLTNVAGLFVGFAMFSSFLLVPLFVQAPEAAGYGFGASVTQAGLIMAPSAAVMLLAGPTAGALGGRYGSRLTLIVGTIFAVASFVVLAVAHTEVWHVILSSILIGAGIAFSMSSMANLVVESVAQRDVGIATGINTIMRTIGGGLGAQLAVTIVTAHTIPGTPLPVESGYTETFLLAAGVAALALLAAVALPTAATSRRH